GTMVCILCGAVQKPGMYGLPMVTPLRELLNDCGGGVRPGRKLKAILSGVANPIALPSHLDSPMDFGSMSRIGSGLGSGGFIVYDDTACMEPKSIGESR